MKAVVQRVLGARVTVDDEIVGAMGRGLLVYLGVGHDDTEDDATWLANKVLALRIFPDPATGAEGERSGKMQRSVLDISGELLVVSQFTLFGDVRSGNRPSFTGAGAPQEAERLYLCFADHARSKLPVHTGRFRADMKVESVNDGPVTLLLDTRELRPPKGAPK